MGAVQFSVGTISLPPGGIDMHFSIVRREAPAQFTRTVAIAIAGSQIALHGRLKWYQIATD